MTIIRHISLIMLLCLLSLQSAFALSEHYYDDDFIIASVVIADPSADALYSALGHAAIRMQCPSENLDYCFSYESEDATQKVLSFLLGKLKMGMFAIPVEEYKEAYREDGRGVYEYQLNLPLETRRELWRILDEELMKGAYLNYDYFNRGCSFTTYRFIKKVVENNNAHINFGPFGGRFNGSNRDLAYMGAMGNEWFHFISAIVGNDKVIDGNINSEDKLIVPIDMVHTLQNATVNGEPVLSNECHVLCEPKVMPSYSWLTPQLIAVLLFVLAVINLFISKPCVDWLFLGIVTLFGAVLTYLLVFSHLPLTDWNWLIIPFNLLPAIAWHWRKCWALPYAGLMAAWVLFVVAWPHFIVHCSLVILTMAWILILLKNTIFWKNINVKNIIK